MSKIDILLRTAKATVSCDWECVEVEDIWEKQGVQGQVWEQKNLWKDSHSHIIRVSAALLYTGYVNVMLLHSKGRNFVTQEGAVLVNRPVTSLGRQVGRRVFWEGHNFF